MIEIGILGGGAAGYFGAILIARQLKGKAKVTILEKGNLPLTKVKISGGGRCNVTHNLFDPVLLSEKYPRGSKELRAAFERFQPKDTIAWFENCGVALKAEADGRMFPVTNTSSTIVNCLVEEASRAGVLTLFDTTITSISIDESRQINKFRLTDQNGNKYIFDKLLIASGSNKNIWDLVKAAGHTIEEPVPSLFSLNISDVKLKELPGLSVPNGEIRIFPKGKPQSGPILITHWGLSGPAVLRLSAWEARNFAECDYKTKVRVNWLGQMKDDEFVLYITDVKRNFPSKRIFTHSQFGFSGRLWEYFLNSSDIHEEKRWSEISNYEIQRLKNNILNSFYNVDGKGVFKDEFVTCGGVKRKEVDFKTMESKIISGLYFAGEVLDIDGITGGFNFQNAWTTAHIAAEGICKHNNI